MAKPSSGRLAGARSYATLDPTYLVLLEAGAAQSRTHVEQMAMSPTALLNRVLPGLAIDRDELRRASFIDRLRLVGRTLHRDGFAGPALADACWISDTVRGWQAMAIGADEARPLEDLLDDLRPFAVDSHFAVREWAWLAARPRVVREPERALAALAASFASANPLDRRFAVELTRPRSVWGAHIALFKTSPDLAEPALAGLRCDPSAYVRTAVGNWLNDAARSRPDWVLALADRWSAACDCAATRAIVRRGTRTATRS